MIRKRSRAGSALIEFAGSLVLLGVTFSGIFEIGYTFFAYNTLVNAVRAGARYASLQPSGSPAVSPEFAAGVRNLVAYGSPHPDGDAKAVVTGLAPEHVVIVMGPDSATVSLRGFELDALFSKVRLDGRPTVTFPRTALVSQ